MKVEHRHDFHQVVLPFKGTMEIEIDGSAGFVDRCQGAFVAADRKHEFISIDASEFIVLDINSSNLFGINCGHDVFQYLDSKKFFPITRQIECLSGYAAIRKTYLFRIPKPVSSIVRIAASAVGYDYDPGPHGPPARSLKERAALNVAYGCGLRVSEIAKLEVSDIDSARMLMVDARRGSSRRAIRQADRD